MLKTTHQPRKERKSGSRQWRYGLLLLPALLLVWVIVGIRLEFGPWVFRTRLGWYPEIQALDPGAPLFGAGSGETYLVAQPRPRPSAPLTPCVRLESSLWIGPCSLNVVRYRPATVAEQGMGFHWTSWK